MRHWHEYVDRILEDQFTFLRWKPSIVNFENKREMRTNISWIMWKPQRFSTVDKQYITWLLQSKDAVRKVLQILATRCIELTLFNISTSNRIAAAKRIGKTTLPVQCHHFERSNERLSTGRKLYKLFPVISWWEIKGVSFCFHSCSAEMKLIIREISHAERNSSLSHTWKKHQYTMFCIWSPRTNAYCFE